MRVMSEKIMGYIMLYVDQYFCDMHSFPSIGEIAQGVGIPKTTAYRYLVEMNNRGMIEYDGKSRTIITLQKSPSRPHLHAVLAPPCRSFSPTFTH